MTPQEILKNRIKLKRLEIQLLDAIEDNFGYCPNYSWFNHLLNQRSELSSLVRETDEKWWDIYDEYQLSDNLKKMKSLRTYI